VHFARDWIPLTIADEANRQDCGVFLQPHGMLGRTGAIRSFVDWCWTKKVLTQATGVMALQEIELRNIRAVAPAARIAILPNGVRLADGRNKWRVETLERGRVLFLARLHPRKRVMDVLEAVRVLLDRGLSVTLRVVGPDEGDLAAAQAFTIAHGLTDSVEFVGGVSPNQVESEFLEASVYVLPSVDEPFPMTVLEAMALGVPTIVTEGIQIREMLERHNAAMVVEAHPNAIASAISKVLTDPQLATSLSENGNHLVNAELGIKQVVDRLEAIYAGTSCSADNAD
jgi:glycosyltransferase involved in cell wall biosynthesis